MFKTWAEMTEAEWAEINRQEDIREARKEYYASQYDDYEPSGDPRRCPFHGIVTSSADGLHDAPCGGCEAEMDEEAAKEEFKQMLHSQP